MYEGPVQNLIDEFGKLPGIGPKSAQRLAFHLLQAEPDSVERLRSALQAVVEGVNIAIRHTRQSQTSQGGRIPKAMPIELSNLALMDANGKATRVGFRMDGDKKVRFAKTTGDVI